MQLLWSHFLPMHYTWTCLLSSKLPMALLLRKYLYPVYFRKQVYFQLFFCFQHSTLSACHPCNFHISAGASAFCLGNRSISFYATHAINATRQQGFSSQYLTIVTYTIFCCSIYLIKKTFINKKTVTFTIFYSPSSYG